jgi:hypothetical protein
MLAFHLPREITYPWVTEPLPTFGCALVVVFVPLLVIAIFQLQTRSLWDFHAGILGVLKAVVSAYVRSFSSAFSNQCRRPMLTSLALADPSSAQS